MSTNDPQPAQIWVDADAIPAVVREIICKAAVRTATSTWFVANHALPLPNSPWIKKLSVSAGFDVADHTIIERASSGDLLITQDIPLAAEAMELGLSAINPRGEPYTAETIRQRLNMRDFYETMRSSGIQSGGPSAFDQRDRQNFANALDRWLAKQKH
ncbi:YaiI/YqxD family protein [Oceanobacter mangrovi]|uniref:YaiI/YqxD family protein n=1 Tax=Oceanobacter mangrovi TaxID=2862510 RepID=UPI001C8EB8B8|nr:YaiI/YqxD family protein [Oceanobacter mangrovi]